MTDDVPLHVVASGLLVRGDALLLCHRSATRAWYPDCWDLVGGHLEAGETPLQALTREVREELGVTVLQAREVEEYADDQVRLTLFVVTQWAGDIANHAPEEHDALRWFTAAELPGLTLADPMDAAFLTRLMRSTG